MRTHKDILLGEMNKYKQGYYILMEYWDSLPDEEREIVHKQLMKIGL